MIISTVKCTSLFIAVDIEQIYDGKQNRIQSRFRIKVPKPTPYLTFYKAIYIKCDSQILFTQAKTFHTGKIKAIPS